MIKPKTFLFASFVLLTLQLSGQDKPNFVWLVSEDNSIHYLKLFDKNGAETPHIEKLAEAGLIFTRAFSNAPVCSVARTTLQTGCYGPRIGTQFHRKSKLVPMPEGLRMFPSYLREAGYYTTNKSKKDYNAIEGTGVWDESSNKASWRKRAAGQPFFHMQSFGNSHESRLHFSEENMRTTQNDHDPASVSLQPYFPNTPTFQYTYARYLDRIQVIDREIGEVVSQLEQDGLLENTFIFYFGDHGGVLPRGKGYAYESGLHVPLVVRVPEKWKHLVPTPRQSKVDAFVSFIDFGPTLLHLAGIKVPQQMDGSPFLGKGITKESWKKRDQAFGYADRFDEKYDFVRTLRKGKYKYMRNYQPFNFDALQNNYRYKMLAYTEWRKLYEEGKLNEAQRQFFESRPAETLFDIEKDPHEVNNLANDPKYREILLDLRTALSNHVKSMPDLSFYPESDLFKRAFDKPVKFGQIHKGDISRLVDIADLSLMSYKKARKGIKKALKSKDPWERYWGLIVCSSFGKEASPMAKRVKKIAATDSELLVRVRAAEFLGLTGQTDPRPIIMDALSKTTSGVEASLILNTLVLLQDGKPGYSFEVTSDKLNPAVLEDDNVKRRLLYLEN